MGTNNIRTLLNTADQQLSNLNASVLSRFLTEEWGLINYSNGAGKMGLEETINKKHSPPELIIHEYSSTAASYNFWSKTNNSWGGIPYLLHINGEGSGAMKWSNPANYCLSFQPTKNKNMQFHTVLLSPFITPMLMDYTQGINYSVHNEEVLKIAYKLHKHFINTAKNKFCNFVYSNHTNSKLDGLIRRQQLCQIISSYKNVDCPGQSMHNTDDLKKMELQHNQWFLDNIGDNIGEDKQPFPVEQRFLDKLRYLSHYKFTIAGENISSPYYMSEKIIHPLIVGSIPIYLGCKEISQLINPKAFINCNDYNSLDEVADLVRQIDNDPKLYQEFISQPPFLQGSVVYDYSREKLHLRMANILKDISRHTLKVHKLKETYKKHGWLRRKLIQLHNVKLSAIIWLWLWQLLLDLNKLAKR